MNKKIISDIDVRGKRVLTRVDFNVPLDEQCNVTDDRRISEALPTIRHIVDKGGIAILMSHLGRPKGKVVESMRLTPAAKVLEQLIGKPVKMLPDCIGPEVEAAVKEAKAGDILVLENLRFYKEEEANDVEFAKKLAALGDVYCNDAFGTAHRAHASTEGVTKFLSPCVAGFLMKKEIDYLVGALENPARPFVAILGGAKVSDKIEVITKLLDRVDTLMIGGGMAYTFLKALGRPIGRSLLEADKIPLAKQIMHQAIDKDVQFLLPIDHVVAADLKAGVETHTVRRGGIPDDLMALDIGPDSVDKFSYEIKRAKTIVWNGPVGVFEIPEFANGTNSIARLLAESNAVTILGGGDSAAAVEKAGVADRITHISTGGGASLELLEGKELPGLVALTNA